MARRPALGFFLLAGILLLIVFLPRLATSRVVLTYAIERFGGIAPLQVDFADVEAGWFRPVKATGIRLLDPNQTVLAKVGEVSTEKGVFSWITGSTQLGTITIRDVEAAIVAKDGTTNIEQALQPWLQTVEPAPEEPVASPPPQVSGKINVVNAKLLVMEADRPEQWVVAVPGLSVTLPTAEQSIGPIDIQATVVDASGTIASSNGTVVANVRQSEATGAFEVKAMVENLPLDVWHVVHARLPEVPLQQLQGRVSATLAGNIVNDSTWSFVAQQWKATELAMVAPAWVGEAPARLQSMVGSAKCTLAESVLTIEDSQLSCDFAQAQAQASVPWPIQVPTLQEPFLAGAVIHAQGSVDLPQLVATANSLLPVRQDMQLLAGKAEFAVHQQLNEQGHPTSQANLQLSGLKATADGQPLSWEQPLSMTLGATQIDGRPRFNAIVDAEFVNIQGAGTIEAGRLQGDIQLDALQQRLRQWVTLPMEQMTGAANLDLSWNLEDKNVVVAQGQLSTTPLLVATNAGKQLQEPAWNGNFSGRLRLDQGIPLSVDQASLNLQSQAEKLQFKLKRPLYLTDRGETAPAMFNLDLHTNLTNCQRRATVWLSEPPDVEVGGQLQLAAEGMVDLQHVELLSANWKSQPLQVTTPQMSLSEPQMVGKFQGRVDTNDLTRLVVEVLQVQSTSFSLGAQDSVHPEDPQSRLGRAMFRVDLDRLMRNVGTGSSLSAQVLPPAGEPPSQIRATGMLHGQLAWQVNSRAAGINTQINGENLVLLSQSPGPVAPQTIWQEPSLTATIAGSWLAANQAVDVQKLQLQTPWLNYDGQVTYRTEEEVPQLQLQGQAIYDSAQLSSKLAPFTGGQVLLSGQQTVPIEVTWKGSTDGTRSALAGLQATTRLGWEQAVVAGIGVGKADVPVQIQNGQLATAAEIPVSGGALRWDLTSDLTAADLVIHQKPMTVLDNVEITEQMCQGWLKYVAPLLAEATSVDGRLSLRLDQAILTPSTPEQQTVVGQIVVHNATVGPGPLSTQVITLAKQVDAIRKKEFSQVVTNSPNVWMDMPEQHIDFQMLNGQVVHRNLHVKVGDANILTGGVVRIDGQMEMLATMPIPDDWADKSPLLAGLRGQSLQFPIRGSLSNPQIDTQLLTQLSRQTIQNAASGLLQQGINRGLDKLLGGQENTLPAPDNPSSNPIQGIGEQLLRGEGLSIPGLFPRLGSQNRPGETDR